MSLFFCSPYNKSVHLIDEVNNFHRQPIIAFSKDTQTSRIQRRGGGGAHLTSTGVLFTGISAPSISYRAILSSLTGVFLSRPMAFLMESTPGKQNILTSQYAYYQNDKIGTSSVARWS